MSDSAQLSKAPEKSSLWSVLLIFLRLGLTSFGGPTAHLGYFRQEFVMRRRWIDEDSFADLLALCQFLPGPASSQVGFAIGVSRGGLLGGLAAWIGFTAPSALALFAFARFAASLNGPLMDAGLHGLKLVAVAIVAQAVWGMQRTLVPDAKRAAIMLAAILVVTFAAGLFGQLGAILLGAVLGAIFCRQPSNVPKEHLSFSVSRGVGAFSLVLFAIILFGAPFASKLAHAPSLALFDAFYRAGALVFGGGHVVLPLLRATVVDPGWVSTALVVWRLSAWMVVIGMTAAAIGLSYLS